MSIGTLTDSLNRTHTLEIFRSDSGRVDDRQVTVEEELLAAGVDGRRWRTVSSRYRVFQAETVTSCADYAAAINKARDLEATIGTNCKLSVTLAGSAYAYSRVHVAECKATPRPGYLSGAGISASNAAYVVATWSLAVIDAPVGSTP